ncbi:MAG: acetolactate synthase catalytic subunit, partial [Alphaproteobacteria bacterium]|nr:acetolactate synthase catalytic subunit [Alphaproteobacteria bacterium]
MTTGSNTSASQVFAGAFARHGVDTIFGQSIPSKFFLSTPEFGIRQCTYRTENAGAVMADAYARISHKVGVVTAQNGPAATLLVAGLAEALTASTPIVALVQDTPPIWRDRNAFQELDHLDLFKGCAKWVRRVEDTRRIDDYVDMAFRQAVGGRPGPAVLLAPVNIMEAEQATASERSESLSHYPLDRPVADPAQIAEAAKLIASAKHPLVWAGGGVHASDAAAVLAELQESCHLPVATTTMGKGAVDDAHPLTVGVIGYYMATYSASKFMRPLVDEADVIIAVGNRTNQNGTDSWQLLPKGARLIHIDIDPQEIGRNHEALRLVGDARATLSALQIALQSHDLSRRADVRSGIEARITAAKADYAKEVSPVATSSAKPVRPERMMADLDKLITPEHILVADASYSSIWLCNNLRSRRAGQRFLTPRGMAGLGWGLPMAMGAKLARPDAPVFAMVGDGGFAHVWAELESARRLGTHLVVVVLNNEILGYQKHAELARYDA